MTSGFKYSAAPLDYITAVSLVYWRRVELSHKHNLYSPHLHHFTQTAFFRCQTRRL